MFKELSNEEMMELDGGFRWIYCGLAVAYFAIAVAGVLTGGAAAAAGAPLIATVTCGLVSGVAAMGSMYFICIHKE